MSERTPWYDRKFDFDFPASKHTEIVDRLRSAPQRVKDTISGFPADNLTQRDGDTWSIQENVGHLFTIEPLWAGRLDDFLEGKETLRPADLTNRRTHQADHNAASIDQLIESFRVERRRFVDRLDALTEDGFATSAMHPRLEKPMRLVDMCLFIAEHDDYHLERMRELAGIFGK